MLGCIMSITGIALMVVGFVGCSLSLPYFTLVVIGFIVFIVGMGINLGNSSSDDD